MEPLTRKQAIEEYQKSIRLDSAFTQAQKKFEKAQKNYFIIKNTVKRQIITI